MEEEKIVDVIRPDSVTLTRLSLLPEIPAVLPF